LANLSSTIDDSEFKLLNNFDGIEALPPALRSRSARDVLVSLKETGGEPGSVRGTTVAIPYEAPITSIGHQEAKTLRFQLLKDLNRVMVSITCAGQVRDLDVQLQRDETEQAIAVKASEPSQEADLGGQVSFDISLERPTIDSRGFQLMALNL